MPEARPALVPELRFPEFRDAGPWEVKRLGDLGPVSMCKRVMKDQTASTGDVPFYKIGTFGKQADAYINRDLYEEFKSKYSYPQKGDILISAAGTIGRTVVYDGKPAYFQDSNIVWIANDEEIATNEFLNFAYQKVNWRTDDNTIARLYNDNLRSIKVALPSLPEQQKIADCLSSLDDLIRAEEGRLEALNAHKTGLMQCLFPAPGQTTPRLRFAEFRDAGPWVVKRLGEIADARPSLSGKTAKDFGVGNARFITYKNVFANMFVDPEQTDFVQINDGERQTTVRRGDMFFTVSSETPEEVGMSSVLLEAIPNCYLNSFCSLFRPNERNILIPGFAGYYLRSDAVRAHFLKSAQGATRYNLNKSAFETLPVCHPSLPEQQKIADCLTVLDDLIRAQRETIEALKTHKRGLMQKLFPREVG